VPLKVIEAHSGACKQTFRVMPNVAAAVAESASCVCKSATATDASLQIEKLFRFNPVKRYNKRRTDESATVLAGCGTAFVLRFIRAMVQLVFK
jgi:pyrroline-5-carboxylate reductase